MTRSPGFGSKTIDYNNFFTPTFKNLSLPNILTHRPIIQKVRRYFRFDRYHSIRFHTYTLFTKIKVYKAFPSQYLFSIGHLAIFRFRGWPPCLQKKLRAFFYLTQKLKLKYGAKTLFGSFNSSFKI